MDEPNDNADGDNFQDDDYIEDNYDYDEQYVLLLNTAEFNICFIVVDDVFVQRLVYV